MEKRLSEFSIGETGVIRLVGGDGVCSIWELLPARKFILENALRSAILSKLL